MHNILVVLNNNYKCFCKHHYVDAILVINNCHASYTFEKVILQKQQCMAAVKERLAQTKKKLSKGIFKTVNLPFELKR